MTGQNDCQWHSAPANQVSFLLVDGEDDGESVNGPLLRPAFRVPRSFLESASWFFLRSRSCWLVPQTAGGTCQSSVYEITELQRPCKVWEHCAERRALQLFWRPVCFSFPSSERDKCWHFSSALRREKNPQKTMALGSWHNAFAFRSRRPSGWTMPFSFWTLRPTSQFESLAPSSERHNRVFSCAAADSFDVFRPPVATWTLEIKYWTIQFWHSGTKTRAELTHSNLEPSLSIKLKHLHSILMSPKLF